MTLSEEIKGKKEEHKERKATANSDLGYQLYIQETNNALINEITKVLTPGTVKSRRSSKAFNLKSSLEFTTNAHIELAGHMAKLFISFKIKPELIKKVNFFMRWGSYEERPEDWVDVKILQSEITEDKEGHYTICKVFAAERRGSYGATVYATNRSRTQFAWQGNGNKDDAKFNVATDSEELQNRLLDSRLKHQRKISRLMFKAIDSYDSFERTVDELAQTEYAGDLATLLYERTKCSQRLRRKLSEHYRSAKEQIRLLSDDDERDAATSLRHILNNLGVGEVVFVSPEGPHAMLGGLAQVMEGAMASFSQNSIPVTLISPMYEQPQGSKHCSAEELIERGITINGQTLPLKRVGEVDISFGPTFVQGTTHWSQHAYTDRAAVYVAETDNMRIVLLRNGRYADYLYPNVFPDEALRRSIFLSRGALEVLKNPLFGIHPQLILSNDWHCALVPVLHKLDLRYSVNPNLKDARTIHLIHNCGRDYHGLIPAQHNRQDLFPMLELEGLHFGGLADPHLPNTMNLTAGAISHLNGALITVSKPYARQLLSVEGGEGLNHLVEKHRGAVFGISNGIDQVAIREKVIKIGEQARSELNDTSLVEKGSCRDSYLANLPKYKSAIKEVLQRKLGLHQDRGRILISIVGRMAEQKGIQLLSGCGEGENISVMESVLCRYPEVQFVVAGPALNGDRASEQFRHMVEHLSWRYPGRIVGIFDFVPHDFALEIFAASDLYLMPSRYEPGGITQLEALCCGALVIARDVGGLSSTLRGLDRVDGEPNSFLFDEFSSTAVRNTTCWAIDNLHYDEHRLWLMQNGAGAQHDWNDRVGEYLAVFQYINGVLDDSCSFKHLEARIKTAQNIRA